MASASSSAVTDHRLELTKQIRTHEVAIAELDSLSSSRDKTKPRWKGKGSEAKASADPMSKIVSQLHYSLIQTETCGLLSSCSVLIEVDAELADLLNRACFGRLRITAQKDKQWFQLDMEETFYLCFSLKCLKVIGEDGSIKSNEELWEYFKLKKAMFPISYKAYSHLRHKNWVVRLGLQYGVDFVAYRHHPALVHSEYAVLALPEGDNDLNGRLRVWSDVHCTVRLCGSVAKTLLIIIVNSNGLGANSLSCIEHYTVEERTITRWNPEQSREDQGGFQNQTKRDCLSKNGHLFFGSTVLKAKSSEEKQLDQAKAKLAKLTSQ